MPTFNNLNDLFKEIKKNPLKYIDDKELAKVVTGKVVKEKCPTCNSIQEIEILPHKKGKCKKCGNQFEINFTIKIE